MMPARRPLLYRGWWMIAALSVTLTTSYGILFFCFTVFLPDMEADFGWSRATLTGAFSVGLLVSGFASIPIGRFLDAHGARWVMTGGSALAALLLVAWSQVHSLPLFYAIWAAMGVSMAACFYEPAFVLLANWFVRKRARALTLLTFGAGFGSVIFVPLAAELEARYDWREAVLILAVILGSVGIPLHALVLRRRPQDHGLLPDGEAAPTAADAPVPAHLRETSMTQRQALRTPAFWWIAAAFCMTIVANVAMLIHLVSYLRDRGFSPAFAASAVAATGLVALPGRLIFTPLGTIIPRRLIAVLIFSLQGFGLLVLQLGESERSVWIFVVLFGAGMGAINPARAQIVVEFFGPKAYGAINGVLAFTMTMFRALAPLGASLLYTLWGGYSEVIWVLTTLSFLACVAIAFAAPPRRPAAESGAAA